jgi:hypothetical protein
MSKTIEAFEVNEDFCLYFFFGCLVSSKEISPFRRISNLSVFRHIYLG